ncbi:putative inhibitor of apoptosis [Dendronephthya gigantea]|uniref:putative inhibitor of apoptosis n=1 Tax=Dendronephthya gigantea TaxID=151771 RepID=UPI00106B4305|nr:putative inhibitor of apoptosis [Dendronephthya gigantea]
MYNRVYMGEMMQRLESFESWSGNSAVKPKDLAEAGFYYLGRGDDTVSCFSCGGTLNDWRVGDIPDERHRRISGNRCEYLQLRLARNVLESSPARFDIRYPPQASFDPICDDDMENEDKRLRSFQRNNGWHGAVEPHKLASAGFYYTGINDHVMCYSCDVSLRCWKPRDDPLTEHFKLNPNCSFLARFKNKFSVTHAGIAMQETGGEFYRSQSQDVGRVYPTAASNPTTQIPQPMPANYQTASTIPNRPAVSTHENRPPAATPVNQVSGSASKYASEHARLHTFISWPKHCPVQPKELIDAGFYYTGSGDRVQCFKCGIILAGWEPHDTPWGEHEKWSKDCPLVREHLRRRNPYSPSQGPRPPLFPQEQVWNTPPNVVDPPEVEPSEVLDEIEPSKVVRLPKEQDEPKVVRLPMEQGETSKGQAQNTEEDIFYIQKAIQKLIQEKRYEYQTITEAVQQRVKAEGGKIDSMAELVDAIESYIGVSTKKATTSKQPSTTKGDSVMPVSIDPRGLHEHAKKLQDALICKVCLDAEAGIVFLPCGHLACCPKCSEEIRSKRDCLCPICRGHIAGIIRTFIT